jgi:tight adherence protein B
VAEVFPILLAGVGGGLLAVALRELAGGLAPGSAEYLGSALLALRRAGVEGRLPNVIERRRLGTLAGLALGLGSIWLLGIGPQALLAGFGPALAGWLIARRQRRYRAAVEAELPAMAGGLADALAAGTSLRGAIADLAPTLEGPARVEIARVNADIAIGLSLERGLRALAERTGSDAVAALVAAIASQQRSGGDLAALLRRHAAAELGRQRARADARSATAQARLTGGMVAAMPLGAAALIELVSPGFIGSMLAEPLATLLLAIAAGLQLAGYVAIQRFGATRP